MKATISGVTVEGTPQEIADYQRIVNGYKPQQTYGTPPYVYKPSITSCTALIREGETVIPYGV